MQQGILIEHATRNIWCCKDCGSEVAVDELTLAFTIQLRILDVEQAALKSAHTQRDLA
ncbi:MAG: hypothetical protein NTV56_02240 [Alphaproteobacteria bacterium]|nr:hypothetical protein [Alphaproteobacteria bacterium]